MKTKIIARSLIVIPMFALFAGCGDSKTPRDVQTERAREQINQRLAEIKDLPGQYDGTLLESASDRPVPFRLNIIESGASYSANIPDELKAATLRGSMVVYSYNSAQRNFYEFTGSTYDAKSGELKLYIGETDTVKAMFWGDKITGEWRNASRELIGKFDVTRVTPR